MKKLVTATLFAIATSPALAGVGPIGAPEVSATGGLAAMAVIGGIAAYFWDRKNRK
ncbi:MAG: hypothetical protein ABF335_06555 [Alphaproteobacteria bacterium]